MFSICIYYDCICRNGWSTPTTSPRLSQTTQPSEDRSFHYINSTLTYAGLSQNSKSNAKIPSPGPGYYMKASEHNTISEKLQRSKSASKRSDKITSFGNVIRNPNGVIENDMYVFSKLSDTVGPGYYSANNEQSTLLKPSFNIKVQQKEPVRDYIEDNSRFFPKQSLNPNLSRPKTPNQKKNMSFSTSPIKRYTDNFKEQSHYYSIGKNTPFSVSK